MSNEILAAIIASVAALIVAIISLVSSLKLQALKSSRLLSDQHLAKNCEALDCLIIEIQKMKDIVLLILKAEDKSFDSKNAIIDITENRKNLFLCYQNYLPHLNKHEAATAHKAKNLTLSIEKAIRESLVDKLYVSEIDNGQKSFFIESRVELTDIQNILRDSKTTLLHKRLML